jgi:hypothetical protein
MLPYCWAGLLLVGAFVSAVALIFLLAGCIFGVTAIVMSKAWNQPPHFGFTVTALACFVVGVVLS